MGSSGANPCPGGAYGLTAGLETSACTDICPIGYSTVAVVCFRVLPITTLVFIMILLFQKFLSAGFHCVYSVSRWHIR